jgi:hypothetical protein
MEDTMQIVLTETDLSKLKPATRADLLAHIFPKAAPGLNAEGFGWDDVVELTPGEIEEFMEGCADETIAGLRVIAEHGPVIRANLLDQAGIDNYGHFQGRVTKRTRTVTGYKHAFLFTWDDWQSEENGGIGHYAVTAATWQSLRIYFKLD